MQKYIIDTRTVYQYLQESLSVCESAVFYILPA